MSDLVQLVVTSHAWPVDEADAASRLSALLVPLAPVFPVRFLRPFLASQYEELTASFLVRAMSAALTARLGPRSWTHRLLLRFAPGSGRPDGVCWFRVGADVASDLGMRLVVSRSAALAELEAPFQGAVGTGLADEAALGRASLGVDDRFNVLTFTKQPVGVLPSGARATAIGGGVCIRACALAAGEQEMRAAIAEVARALSGSAHALSQSAAETASPPSPVRPPAVVTAPAASSLDAYETALIPTPYFASPAVPFSGETPPERLAEMFDPVEPRERHPEPGPDETALVPVQAFVMPKTGTFRDQLGPLVVPVISLDEYAELRARLTVYGESHEPTLRRFGVAAREVHEAVRGRFSEYFLRDPNAQAQFLKSMQLAISRVRQERDKEGT